MSTAIHQEIVFGANPQRVYEALLDSKQFSQLTGGAPAQIDATEGGAFSCFGGMVTGRNIELRPNQRIVQAWRVGTWPEGQYSIARFELSETSGGSSLTFDQDGFPENAREHLEGGWHKMYWEPLTQYLGS
jgi:activator of HSP90 ATPase